MKRGGSSKDGIFIFDDPDTTTMADKDFFKFQGLERGGFAAGMFGIIGNAKSDFATVEFLQIFERFFI